jgi:hypothetical protein
MTIRDEIKLRLDLKEPSEYAGYGDFTVAVAQGRDALPESVRRALFSHMALALMALPAGEAERKPTAPVAGTDPRSVTCPYCGCEGATAPNLPPGAPINCPACLRVFQKP